ncbi:hypothetical protein D3C73_831110 [compost metagenome]
MVNAQHQRNIIVLARCRDNDSLGTALGDMHFGLGFVGEEARRLNHYLNTHAAPWDGSRISFGENMNRPTIEQQLVLTGFDAGCQSA